MTTGVRQGGSTSNTPERALENEYRRQGGSTSNTWEMALEGEYRSEARRVHFQHTGESTRE